MAQIVALSRVVVWNFRCYFWHERDVRVSTNEHWLTAILFSGYWMQIWTTLFNSFTKRYARLDPFAVHVKWQMSCTDPIGVGLLFLVQCGTEGSGYEVCHGLVHVFSARTSSLGQWDLMQSYVMRETITALSRRHKCILRARRTPSFECVKIAWFTLRVAYGAETSR